MAKVKLGDVARECKLTVKDAKGLPTVGLEHLIPGQVELTQWSENSDNTFTKGFKKGQMLFGRRRAYLKKASLAPFDGVCSGDIIVIEAIPERILPKLLPFVIQNDNLFDYAVEKSAGSLSPRVKWEHLRNYEFELPDLAQQEMLTDLLWAMTRTKKAYQALVNKTDELVKSQFIEMTQGTKWQPSRMGDIASYINGAAFKPKDWSREGRPIIRIQNLNDPDAEFNYYDGELDAKYLVKPGDVLVSWATHLEAYIWNGPEAWLNQHIFKVVFDKGEVDKVFFIYAANVALKEAFKKAHGFKATMEHIKRGDFEDSEVMIPNIAVQNQFAAFVEQSDKSKFELVQAISRIDEMIKAFMQA